MTSGREVSGGTRAWPFLAYLAISGLISLAIWVLLLLPNFLGASGWSAQSIGWAVGTYFVTNLFAQMLAGHLADRFGNLRTALWGAAIGCLAGLAYIATYRMPDLIFPARALHAAAAALISAGILIELIGSVPADLRGRMMGYYGLPGFVMLGAGPVLSEWFVYHWGFRGTLSAVAVIFAAVGVIVMRLPASATRGQTVRREPFRKAFHDSFPLLRPVLGYSVVVGLCFASWQSFLAPAVQGLGRGAVSNFGFGYAAGAVMTRLGLSHRVDTGPKRLAGIATLIGFGVALAAIPQASRSWHLLGIGFACGMSHGIYYPSLSSIAAERFHPVHGGQAMSLYISASSLGMFVGPPLWGAFADVAGYKTVFAASGALLAAATAAFVCNEWLAHRRTRAAGRRTRQIPGSDCV